MRHSIWALSFERKAAAFVRSADAVASYRRNGYLFVPDTQSRDMFAHDGQLQEVYDACCEAVRRRGDSPVPQQDPNTRQFATMTHKLVGNPEVKSSDVGQPVIQFDKDTKVHTKVIKMRLKLRTQKEVDQAYEKLTYARRKAVTDGRLTKERADELSRLEASEGASFNQSKTSAAMTSTALSGSHHPQRVELTREQAEAEFAHYRDSGNLERDVRKRQHIDDAFQYAENMVQSWMRVWRESDGLKRVLFAEADKTNADGNTENAASSSLGARIGDVAGALSGSVVMRLFDDAIVRLPIMANAMPVHFHGAFTCFRDARGLDVLISLPTSEALARTDACPHVVVYPGSHRMVASVTQDGAHVAKFQRVSLWDIGDAVRTSIPALGDIEPVVIPMKPGSMLFANNLLIRSMIPAMGGRVNSTVPPSGLAQAPQTVIGCCPMLYMLQLMPDGATFDGSRNTWMAKDMHGPLYKYHEGQCIRDNIEFPVLYSDLDIE